jgi:hypothetical protein
MHALFDSSPASFMAAIELDTRGNHQVQMPSDRRREISTKAKGKT